MCSLTLGCFCSEGSPGPVWPCSQWQRMLFESSQYLYSSVTPHILHYSLVLSGKCPIVFLCSHFGRRTLVMPWTFPPFLSLWFAKDVSHAMQFFVTATSHCCRGCRDHVAPVIHVEPPAASSPASRKLHQEGMRFTLSPADSSLFFIAPINSRRLFIAVSKTQSLTGFPHWQLFLSQMLNLEMYHFKVKQRTS